MNEFKFAEKLRALEKVKKDLPLILAKNGERFFQQQFNKSSWDGKQWAPRKTTTKKNSGKHLLVQSGRLRQSLQNSVKSASFKEIIWGSDVPYAGFHNEGTKTIPKREFMGDSKQLRALLKDKIMYNFKSIFK